MVSLTKLRLRCFARQATKDETNWKHTLDCCFCHVKSVWKLFAHLCQVCEAVALNIFLPPGVCSKHIR